MRFRLTRPPFNPQNTLGYFLYLSLINTWTDCCFIILFTNQSLSWSTRQFLKGCCYISAPVPERVLSPRRPRPSSWRPRPQGRAPWLPARHLHLQPASDCMGNSSCRQSERTPHPGCRLWINIEWNELDANQSNCVVFSPTLCHPLCQLSRRDPGTKRSECDCCHGEFAASSGDPGQHMPLWKHPPGYKSDTGQFCVTEFGSATATLGLLVKTLFLLTKNDKYFLVSLSVPPLGSDPTCEQACELCAHSPV